MTPTLHVLPPTIDASLDDGQEIACDSCGTLYWSDERTPGEWCNVERTDRMSCDGLLRRRDDWHSVALRSFELAYAEAFALNLDASKVAVDGYVHEVIVQHKMDTARDFILRLVAEVRKARAAMTADSVT